MSVSLLLGWSMHVRQYLLLIQKLLVLHQIAEQMGRTLQKTSISLQIKERLDFSCAIFDADGNLVANAVSSFFLPFLPSSIYFRPR